MNAATFYENFEMAFAQIRAAAPQFKKLAGRTSKWAHPIVDGSLVFPFSVNPKSAGLLPHMPGEFGLKIAWRRGKGAERREHYVSLFQYTNEAERNEYAALQRAALEKFFRESGKEKLRSIYSYDDLPVPNIQEYHYYFDADDVRAWGHWYKQLLPDWVERFAAAPESNNDWAWRVLWPHLNTAKENAG